MIERRLPGLGPNPDYSRAIYPDPPSHDFCVWLVQAELMRRIYCPQYPLQVRFATTNGMLGSVDYADRSIASQSVHGCNTSRAYYDLMLTNVLRPAIKMIGAIEEPTVELETLDLDNPGDLANYVEYDYHTRNLVDASRAGYLIPHWKTVDDAWQIVENFLGGIRPIVITLRETDSQPERNSNLDAWTRFAESLFPKYRVIVVRDTDKANEPFRGFMTWPQASRDVYIRHALYQHALVNMMVGNGPNVWAMFSNAPYLIFKQLVPSLPAWEHGQPRGWEQFDHMQVGESYPWAAPNQRLTWTDDTFGNISEAFERFMDESERRA